MPQSQPRGRRKSVVSFVALLTMGALCGASAVPDASATDSDLVIAVFSESPTASLDARGFGVKLVDELSDVGESIAIVRTNSGQPARITTQYGTPASDAAPTEYPRITAEEPPAELRGEAMVRSGSFGPGEVGKVDQADLELQFVSAITSTTASFAWKPDIESDGYTVLRDGKVLAQTADPSFTDVGLRPNAVYSYEIVGTFDSETSADLSFSRHVPVSTLTDERSTLDAIASGAQPLVYQTYTTAFMYKTFITQNRVKADLLQSIGCDLSVGQSSGGDNRGFALPGSGAPHVTPSYRTMMFFNVNWDNPAPWDLIWSKGVGATKKYSSSGTLLETRYASDSSMVFQNPSRSGNYAQVGMSHEAGHPFCMPPGAIRYSLTNVQFYRSGTVSVLGSRQPVPAHEAYARFSNVLGIETWRTLYQGAQGSFTCLLPSTCGAQTINKSYTF